MPAPELPPTWTSGFSRPSEFALALEKAAGNAEDRYPEPAHPKQTKASDVGTIDEQAAPDEAEPQVVSEALSAERENTVPVPKLPVRSPASPKQSLGSKSTEDDDHSIDDRDVLRGLHIAISAACDEEVDRWIRCETGVRIRRFLADLKAFEMLGKEEMRPDPREQRARERRAQLRKLKAQIRKSRAAMKQED